MMSIRRKITLLFLVSLLLMLFIAFWVQRNNMEKSSALQINRYLNDARTLLPSLVRNNSQQIEKQIQALGLTMPKTLPRSPKQTLRKEPLGYGEVHIFKTGEKSYLQLRYLDDTLLLYDPSQEQSRQERVWSYLLFGFDIVLLTLIYLTVMRILSPLQGLSRTMQRFAKGEHSVRTKIRNKDEIGDLAQSFNHMAGKLQETLHSKEMLLKEVGHELKTPISRGKFALDALEETAQKETIKTAFDELEQLTDAILQEKRIDDEPLHYSTFRASTLILHTLSKLQISEEQIEIEVEDFEIEADRYYMEMALKNLIENAVKYTEQFPVRLKAVPHQITIESEGAALKHPFSYYFQPFTRDHRDKEGFGLGLGIVHKIIQKHTFRLQYYHKNGKNLFSVLFAT